MAYDRRNLNLYHRGGGGNPLPSSYRNKALLIVGATALYTAFLYHSGTICFDYFCFDGQPSLMDLYLEYFLIFLPYIV